MTPTAATARIGAMDDLSVLLSYWQTHLRACNVPPGTMLRYLRACETLRLHLLTKRMPTAASAIKRDHLAAFPADQGDRVAGTVAATTGRSSSSSAR